MADDDKELKDQRVVTMMTPSELEAIDDWMFKNRIRSRGEAIRRLCRMALGVEEQTIPLTDRILDLSNLVFEFLDEGRKEDVSTRDVLNAVFSLMDAHAELIVPFGQMRGEASVEEAMKKVEEWRERLRDPDAFKHAGQQAANEMLAMAELRDIAKKDEKPDE
jgi:hypothetical protein